jgi:hypothetical protein
MTMTIAMTTTTTAKFGARLALTFSGVLLAVTAGCGFFENDGEADIGADASDTESTDDGGDPPPTRGFRVFPKFMLIDVPAIVTLDVDGVSANGCPSDTIEGGYLCDASELQAGGLATIRVERDGFDTAVRQPEVPFGQIVDLDVHLAVEGGPQGIWSDCSPAAEFESCDALCTANFMDICLLTSCATDQPESPLGTFETYLDADCLQLEQTDLSCDATSGPGAVSVRCCCG